MERDNKDSVNPIKLNERLNFNQKYSSQDFNAWLFGFLDKIEFDQVLDVGCGVGTQSLWFSEKLKEKGSVLGIDVSEKSITEARKKIVHPNVVFSAIAMEDISDSIYNIFKPKRVNLIHSSFAFYYAKKPIETLKKLHQLLSEDGVFAISGPSSINTFLNYLSRYQEIKQEVWDCLEFIDDIVLSFVFMNFKEVETHLFVNNQYVDNFEDIAEYYKSSTFYDDKLEDKILSALQKEIKEKGYFHIQKNSKLVIGKYKRM